MQVQVLQSRLNPPSLTGDFLYRSNLMNRLSDCVNGKMALISAPAGYGKTTLAAQWLLQQDLPFAWISADRIHRDPRVFMQYLLSALGKTIDIFNQPFWQIAVFQTEWDPEYILGQLINEVIESESRFILAIDDYHLIDSGSINSLISFLLNNLPPTITLVIMSRMDPHLSLAALRAKREIVELRIQDLQFDSSETHEILDSNSSSVFTDSDIGRIHENTEGWITGIHLSSLANSRNASDLFRFTEDFFLDVILEKEDELLVSFLYQTSVLSYLHAPLCDALLPDFPRSSDDILSELLEKNLFIKAVGVEDGWFVLHPLFRDSLVAGRNCDISQLHKRAGQWYWDRGQYGECFNHLRLSEDFSMMAEYLMQCWDSMDQVFQHLPWLEWAEQLPESVILMKPLLMIQIIWATLQLGRLEESEALMNRHESRLLSSPNRESFMLQIYSARSYLAFVRRDLDRTVTFAKKMEELADPDDAVSNIQAHTYIALCLWYSGKLEMACRKFIDFRDVMLSSQTPFLALASYIALVQIRIRQGRTADAKSLLSEALIFEMGPADILSKFKATLHLKAAILDFELDDRESADKHLEICTKQSHNGSLIDYHYQWHQFMALIYESDGRLDKALDELLTAEHLYVRTMIIDDISIGEQKARILIRSRKKTTLRKNCGGLFHKPVPVPSCQNEPELIIRIRYILAFNREPSALREQLDMSERLLEIADREKRRKNTIELLILKSYLLYELGQKQDAVDALKKVLVHVDDTGFVQAVIMDRELLNPLFLEFQDQLETIEAFQWIRNSLRIHENRNQVLSSRELEVLRLMARGLSNKSIGEELFLAETTIKGHNQKIFQKLNVQNRTEAISEGRKSGLID